MKQTLSQHWEDITMARATCIDSIPEGIRDQLIKRLFDSNFSAFREHEEWAAGLGYKLPKSAIHRFSQSIEQQLAEPEIRLRVAQVAAGYSSADSIVENSSALLRWVVTAR
jgi:hypothetical protein